MPAMPSRSKPVFRLPVQLGGPAEHEANEPFDAAIAAVIEPVRRHPTPGVYVVDGVPHVPKRSLFPELESRLAPYNAMPLVEDIGHGTVRVVVLPKGIDERMRKPTSLGTHILLLAITLLTTTYVGAQQQGVDLLAHPGRFAVGLAYALTLLSILGIHELGHYFMGRHHHVEVTPPYFIPVPFGLGTFGAFIQIKSLIKTRRAVFDIGIAGPLAGLAVAIPLLYIGLHASTPLNASGALPAGAGATSGSSLLLAFMYQLVHGRDPAIVGVQLSPVAFAAWIGIFVTGLNLLPVGQLDGGHIAYALVGSRRARTVSMVTVMLMVAAGLFMWPNLLTWAFILALFAGFAHMPALDDLTPPDMGRVALGVVTLLLPLLVLIPTHTR